MNLIVFFITLLFTTTIWAYPIVSESEKIKVGDILTLYPDHKDTNKVYFFPNSSMIARDSSNLPMFSLTTWGLLEIPYRPDQAGAWLTFTARLTSDPLQKKALESYLKDFPTKRLAVIPVKDTVVGIKSSEGKVAPFEKLIEQMSLSDFAGHAEDEIGFMGTLTGIGAKVFKEAVKKPDMFKIFYCYSFDGAGPDMDALIKVDFKRVYSYFRTSVSFSKGWFSKVHITKEVEKLKQQGAVSWEINGGNANDEEYIKLITNSIVKRLFVPELQVGAGNPGDSKRDWPFISFNLHHKSVEELKNETWTISRRQIVERDRCVPINVRDVSEHFSLLVSDT